MKKDVKVNVTVDRETADRMRELAERRHTSVSQLLSDFVWFGRLGGVVTYQLRVDGRCLSAPFLRQEDAMEYGRMLQQLKGCENVSVLVIDSEKSVVVDEVDL